MLYFNVVCIKFLPYKFHFKQIFISIFPHFSRRKKMKVNDEIFINLDDYQSYSIKKKEVFSIIN